MLLRQPTSFSTTLLRLLHLPLPLHLPRQQLRPLPLHLLRTHHGQALLRPHLLLTTRSGVLHLRSLGQGARRQLLLHLPHLLLTPLLLRLLLHKGQLHLGPRLLPNWYPGPFGGPAAS